MPRRDAPHPRRSGDSDNDGGVPAHSALPSQTRAGPEEGELPPEEDNRLPASEYKLPAELSRLFQARVSVADPSSFRADGEVRLSDVSQLNFTAIQLEIDNQLQEYNKDPAAYGVNRQGRMLPAFLSSAVNLFDIKQVWREIETSVMSSVSCTACKAGEYDRRMNVPYTWICTVSQTIVTEGVGILMAFISSESEH